MCSAPTSKCGQESVHMRADRDRVIKITRMINRFVTLCWIKYRVNLTLMEKKKKLGHHLPAKLIFLLFNFPSVNCRNLCTNASNRYSDVACWYRLLEEKSGGLLNNMSSTAVKTIH